MSHNKTEPKKLSRIEYVKSVKVEKIILSSTDSRDSQRDSCTDSSKGINRRISNGRTRRRRRWSSSDSRSVVTPPMFEMDGTVSLRDYLRTFEIYFGNKFKGDSYDKMQMLSKFLSGDLMKVYNIRGGRRLRYTNMTEELSTYHRKQKIGGRSY